VLEFALAIGMMLVVISGAWVFGIWVFRQWLHARRYRHLVKLYHLMPKQPIISNVGPRWEVNYRDKRAQKTVIIPAETEGEMMRELMKQGIDYTKVVNFRKL
jgi:flagellar biosynthesis/type III secretory pathway M-ring protein FliF/YscJ